MKKLIVCLIFLISFANAIQCYNGKTYVDIPESKLTEIGYTKYNITHSKFDYKIAYKRYLKIKEIEPVNDSKVTKDEKNKLEKEPSKMMRGFWAIVFVILPITLLFNNDSVYDIQSVAIIAAVPTGLVMLLIIGSFWKELRKNQEI